MQHPEIHLACESLLKLHAKTDKYLDRYVNAIFIYASAHNYRPTSLIESVWWSVLVASAFEGLSFHFKQRFKVVDGWTEERKINRTFNVEVIECIWPTKPTAGIYLNQSNNEDGRYGCTSI